jgi:hypothetical protein
MRIPGYDYKKKIGAPVLKPLRFKAIIFKIKIWTPLGFKAIIKYMILY